MNIFFAVRLPDFTADITDIDIDDVGIAGIIIAPDFFQYLFPRQDNVLVSEKIREQFKFFFRKQQLAAGYFHFMAVQIEGHILEMEEIFRCLVRIAVAEQDADTGQQFFAVEWFGEIIVAAHVESGDFCFHVVLGRKEHDGDIGNFPRTLAQGQAVYVGQHDIQQDEVEVVLADAFHGFGTIIFDITFIPFMLQLHLDEAGNLFFIFYNQYMRSSAHSISPFQANISAFYIIHYTCYFLYHNLTLTHIHDVYNWKENGEM